MTRHAVSESEGRKYDHNAINMALSFLSSALVRLISPIVQLVVYLRGAASSHCHCYGPNTVLQSKPAISTHHTAASHSYLAPEGQPTHHGTTMPSNHSKPASSSFTSEHDRFIARQTRNGEDLRSILILFETEFPKVKVDAMVLRQRIKCMK